ncbi:esterase OVCA2-like isoform X3 [Varroa jacobsoni]|uniref:Serine hydrolase domain-containing protein n=1 Tax=Varroa destructor TaxID=109461 RepID=A0A7M7M441_VARDE|nr:esterase OVCA2-like isoform X2 [Varroa destructor]XP_022647253.1 esterase OVCA2-like isoform X2 [Varroa destructor]XP_022647254.1 esterase OVCA2-like isoform X2 [Varroa destructor]XP_022647255.1 esterase OVCA2-like isoform X2 [Varroa destructor]XP_022686571.1 esterase OVCA2-like isoform X3 [Varroa jacobsoni]XP_022686644.1 esterase OVCA2-like isoform X3 [Varroa jacobsoni]
MPHVQRPGASRRVIRVICLHGYKDSANEFSKGLDELRAWVGPMAEFAVVSGQELHNNEFCWYPNRFDLSCPDEEVDQHQLAWLRRSVRSLEEYVLNYGPFDGILGFSQGAMFATMVLQVLRSQAIDPTADTKGLTVSSTLNCFKFAILFCPCEERSPYNLRLEVPKIAVPTMLCLARYDDMIPVEVGKQFMRLFDHAELHVYEGAHWLPMDVEFGPVIRKFLQKFWVIDDSN